MAKTKDAAPHSGISKRGFLSFLSQVKDLLQEVNDANMAHAQEWKQADKLGIHPQSAKLILRLSKMEDAKRQDFLRSFDKYRQFMGWDAQGDMFDQKASTEPGDDDMGGTGGAEPEREPAAEPLPMGDPGEPRAPLQTSDEILRQEQEAQEEVEETSAAHVEELAGGGFTFNAGRDAAERGDPAESNPHPEATPSHKLWANGHALGVANAAAAKEEDNVVSLPSADKPKGRRRGGTDASGSTAVH